MRNKNKKTLKKIQLIQAKQERKHRGRREYKMAAIVNQYIEYIILWTQHRKIECIHIHTHICIFEIILNARRKWRAKKRMEMYEIFTYFSGQVFQNCSAVNGSGGTNAAMACCTIFQMPVDSSNGELNKNEVKYKK